MIGRDRLWDELSTSTPCQFDREDMQRSAGAGSTPDVSRIMRSHKCCKRALVSWAQNIERGDEEEEVVGPAPTRRDHAIVATLARVFAPFACRQLFKH
jgi:hypothetical protein